MVKDGDSKCICSKFCKTHMAVWSAKSGKKMLGKGESNASHRINSSWDEEGAWPRFTPLSSETPSTRSSLVMQSVATSAAQVASSQQAPVWERCYLNHWSNNSRHWKLTLEIHQRLLLNAIGQPKHISTLLSFRPWNASSKDQAKRRNRCEWTSRNILHKELMTLHKLSGTGEGAESDPGSIQLS